MLHTFAWADDCIADPSFEQYAAHFRTVDPRFHIAMHRPEEVHSDVAVIEPRGFEKSDLFNACLKPYGIRYTLFGSFTLAEGEVFPIAFMRPKAAGAFQRDEVSHLASLVPNLKHALRLHELVRRLADEIVICVRRSIGSRVRSPSSGRVHVCAARTQPRAPSSRRALACARTVVCSQRCMPTMHAT